MLKKRQQQQPQRQQQPQPLRPEAVYHPFPHRHSPLKDDVLPWAQAGAYFVLCGEGSTRRVLHRHCSREMTTKLKLDIPGFVDKHPVVVLDLAACPVLIQDDQEWIHSIIKVDPSYVHCTCSFMRYMLDEPEVPRLYYRLEMPYHYLCNMNRADDGRYASLPHEEMYRADLLKKQQKEVLDTQSREGRYT